MSDWVAEGEPESARQFVQDWLDDPACPMPTVDDVMRMVLGLPPEARDVTVARPGHRVGATPRGVWLHEEYLTTDETLEELRPRTGPAPHAPQRAYVSRQLYSALVSEHPEIVERVQPYPDPLPQPPTLEQLAAAQDLTGWAYWPPSAPLVHISDCTR